jgi:glycosyltransferase involved in cell wall biosynthesis
VKVIILHQFFNTPATGGALRSYYLAKALVDHGVEPIVITTHNKSNVHWEEVEGITVHYLPVAYSNHYGFIRRVYSFLKFVASIVTYAGRFRDASLCYAISAPLTTGLAARWISFRYRIPYYFEVGDLWPEAPIQMGVIRNAVLKKMLYALEKSIYTGARAIVALSPPIKAAIEKKISGKPIHLIPNMADTIFYMPEKKNPSRETTHGVSGKFVIAYIGTIGLANGLEYLAEVAAQAQMINLPVHILICGDGAVRSTLLQSSREKGLSNISFIPHQQQAGVREILSITDAVFVSYKNLPVLETGSPNKFFDGLASGKLIILNVGGWLAAEVKKYECGIQVDPEDPADCIKRLMPYLADPAMVADTKAAARKLAETKYARSILSEQFSRIILKEVQASGS